MEKPKHSYKPGTVMFRLIEEDWSRKSIEQIEDDLSSTYDSIRTAIHRIKRDTGYQVPYLHLPSTHNRYKPKGTFSPQIVLKKKTTKIPNNCCTCWNTDCIFMEKRKIVCWENCGGWIGENV